MRAESISRSSIQLPTCSECLYSTKLCFDRLIDFIQSREGRKKIRQALVPFFLIGSLLMIVAGAIWGRVTNPICGISYGSAQFSIHTDFSTGERIFKGNSCPGYDWTKGAGKSSLLAGQFNFKYALSTTPKLSNNKVYVESISGAIGIALNGIPIYSPAGYELEQYIVDECGGSVSSVNTFVFGANDQLPGYYHYRFLPGSTGCGVSNFTYCAASSSWYNKNNTMTTTSSSAAVAASMPSSSSSSSSVTDIKITKRLSSSITTQSSSSLHSPLVGWMADGIPIYGPYTTSGTLPLDLDECGGHSSDDHHFYHYHFQPKFPYSVACLHGCLDGSMNNKLNSGNNCNISITNRDKVGIDSRSDYTSFQYYTTTYGGTTANFPDWTGPITLLIFGFVIFTPACLCCICALCSQKKRSQAHMNGGAPWWVEQRNNSSNNSNNGGINNGGSSNNQNVVNDLDMMDDDDNIL